MKVHFLDGIILMQRISRSLSIFSFSFLFLSPKYFFILLMFLEKKERKYPVDTKFVSTCWSLYSIKREISLWFFTFQDNEQTTLLVSVWLLPFHPVDPPISCILTQTSFQNVSVLGQPQKSPVLKSLISWDKCHITVYPSQVF